jgi:hypothetical protein
VMPFAARRRHQYWTSDVRNIDHELGGRAYVVSVMDNHTRYTGPACSTTISVRH